MQSDNTKENSIMKIKKIHVENYKPINEQDLNLNGCSAIITASNDKGKSSLLRGLIDRLHSDKADMIVKEGEEKGVYSMELTDGSKIEWNFTQKSERLSYTTADGIKQTSGVIGAIGEKYFGKQFDIDSFLNSGPKAQQKELESIVGVDLDEIEERYKEAYEARTEANRKLKDVKARDVEEPEKVEKPNVEAIKEELEEARNHNERVNKSKREAEGLQKGLNQVSSLIDDTPFEELFDYDKAQDIIDSKKSDEELIDLSDLKEKLHNAQDQLRKYDNYEYKKEQYEKWLKEKEQAEKEAERADQKVKQIEQEKQEAIANADMPDGFDVNEDGLTYNGYPLDEKQISTSSKYIAALKLGAMVLGEVRALHFDAATLDKKNLDNVKEWADENDLQLLIERPDYDGGEIQYQIINE